LRAHVWALLLDGPYRGQCQRPIGLGWHLDLENLTLACSETFTVPFIGPMDA